MIVWTLQHIEDWQSAESDGVLRSVNFNRFSDEDFKRAYDWMRVKMSERIGPPPTPNSYPIWAWYQHRDSNNRKPDLRQIAFDLPEQEYVRVEFEMPNSHVLLSDFDMWHFVLNYWYVGKDEDDDEYFDRLQQDHDVSYYDQPPLPVPNLHRLIEES
jgi:hypothetical protein